MAFFQGVGVVAFAPGADFGAEPGGEEVTGRGSAGGVGCVRVEEVRHQGGGAGGAEGVGFVGDDSFHRVLVDPRDGAPLEIGRTSYRLTQAMKKTLQLRDGRCTFPGCNNHSPDNETDHLHAWEHGGTTGITKGTNY
ncbi:hypothetical protein ARTHRO9AX_270008 [Arthrobacter sp. 9AX]|nr:hypothetical protein ARTHRO9AX_270008 [Arthrobacter sp. 9AX]